MAHIVNGSGESAVCIMSKDGQVLLSVDDRGPVKIGPGTVPAGPQAAHMADPSGGATVDSQARTAINAILDALEAFGIVASA